MAAERGGTGRGLSTLALVLAAIGELEAERLHARRGTRTLHASDVLKHLAQNDVQLERTEVVNTLRVAIGELGLATGVFAPGEEGVADVRSLHVTMSGIRWLRGEVERNTAMPEAPEPSEVEQSV